MKINNWIMFTLNLLGITLLLMIPVYNIWYMGQVTERNWFKECKEWWDL